MGEIIDISYYQGTIDWSIAQNYVDLAIIRTSYSTTLVDEQYQNYVAGCKTYGIPFGHYHYSTFQTMEQAVAEADFFVSLIDSEAKFLVLDVEDATQVNAGLVENSQAFINRVRNATGKRIGIYSGDAFYQANNLSSVNADFRWIARYSGTGEMGAPPEVLCELWQYTDMGTVPGISGNVDLNVLNGTWTLEDFIGTSKIGYKVAENANAFRIQSGKYNTREQAVAAMNELLQEGYLLYAEEHKLNSDEKGWRFVSGKYTSQADAVAAASRAIQAQKLYYATILGTVE